MNTFYLQWHITNKCHNLCMHCYQDDYNDEIRFDESLHIINDIKKTAKRLNAVPLVTITGGDPMRSDVFFEIISELENKNISYSILGNPELLSEKNIKCLSNYKIMYYQLSLDGTEYIHDKIRYKGSYDKTIQAIRNLINAGIKVNILSTVTDINILTIKEVMEIAYELGVNHWDFSRYVGEQVLLTVNKFDYRLFLEEIYLQHKYYENIGKKKLSKEPLLAILKNPSNKKTIIGGCSLGCASLSILPDKTVMACRRYSDSVLGKWSVNNSFLNFVVNNEKMKSYRDFSALKKCNECSFLNSCRGCRAIANCINNKNVGIDPQCSI